MRGAGHCAVPIGASLCHPPALRNETLSGRDSKLCLVLDRRGRSLPGGRIVPASVEDRLLAKARALGVHLLSDHVGRFPSTLPRPTAHPTRVLVETSTSARRQDGGLMSARRPISLTPAAPKGHLRALPALARSVALARELRPGFGGIAVSAHLGLVGSGRERALRPTR